MTPDLTGRAGPALALAGAAAYGAAVVAVDPFRPRLVGCPVHGLTGGWCPGCGSTRAVDLLLRGDLDGAVAHNALVVPALLLVAWAWAAWATATWLGRRPRGLRSPAALRWTPLAVGVVVVLFTVARNLPFFGGLAPPP